MNDPDHDAEVIRATGDRLAQALTGLFDDIRGARMAILEEIRGARREVEALAARLGEAG